MKTEQRFQYLCLTSCLAVLLVMYSSHAADTTKDEEAIKAVVTAFEKAMNAKDAAAFSMVFHEGADFIHARGMIARGRKAIEAFHRPLFEGDGTNGIPSYRNAVLKVVVTHIRFVQPGVADVGVEYTRTGSVLNGKDRGRQEGLMNWLITKERGTWSIDVMLDMDPVAAQKAP